jgi:hypothetical protein
VARRLPQVMAELQATCHATAALGQLLVSDRWPVSPNTIASGRRVAVAGKASSSPQNTGDKLRSSIACAGFVCFIPLFGRSPHLERPAQ